MSTWFQDNLLRYLPAEFAAQDLDVGDLADYLEILTLTLDDLDELVSDFPKIFDVDECDADYLPLIAKVLHYPLDERDQESDQREQLRNAVLGYRRKGLNESFRILFYSLGYVVSLVELWTEDYETFQRYPATWHPPVFPATAYGTTETEVSITTSTQILRVSVDGSNPRSIQLTLGEDRYITAVAEEIDAEIDQIGGDCVVDGGTLVIRSRRSGENAFVSIQNVENSAHTVLGFELGETYGIDRVVPDDLPLLLENGGTWYKSPHFGVEIFSIKDYVTDPEEIEYLRDRMELVRPVHTVLEFLTYIKSVADAFDVQEDNLLGVLTPEIAEIWPFPICMRRNSSVIYIRDGLVPDRSVANAAYYQHVRNGVDNTYKRGEFVFSYPVETRDDPSGPPSMPDRVTPRYFRSGVPIGEPTRVSCDERTEDLDIDLVYSPPEPWTASLTRLNGFILRDQEDTYYRDGTFSRNYTRNNGWFRRGGGLPVDLDAEAPSWAVYNSISGSTFLPGTGELQGHSYVEIPFPGGYFPITRHTVLEFDFEGLVEGDVHAIGVDNNGAVGAPVMIFQVWGSDPGTLIGGTADTSYDNYFPALGVRRYKIPIGTYFAGQWASRIVLVQDDEVSDAAVSRFTNVTIQEAGVEYLDWDQVVDRSGANPVLESTDLFFERPDLPGIWFATLSALNDPAVLDLPDLPGPDPP
jgi:phage tail-like protein